MHVARLGQSLECGRREGEIASYFEQTPTPANVPMMGGGDKPPPISLTDHSPLTIGRWFLCDLAENLGFEDLVAANIHLDLLGLGFGLLNEVDLQHALS